MDKWIQVEGIAGGGQLRPQGRIRSGGAFANLGSSAISADGIYEIPEGITEIRIDRTVVGSGTPTAIGPFVR